MPSYTDQLGRTINLSSAPQRIVSLVPSQTELLFDLGLDNEVVGITKFCVHPSAWFHSKARIGGTKSVKMDVIHQLQPDLIIANKEENVQEQVEALSAEYPTWISDITTLEDALDMIDKIGHITATQQKATTIINTIKDRFAALTTHVARLLATNVSRPRTAYLIWRNPYMTIGGDTFIHDILTRCGFINIFEDRQRYPDITIEELQNSYCELLLLSSEPFPFKAKHISELGEMLPGTRIGLADGEMFSWYGSRLLHAPSYLEKLIDIAHEC